VRLADRPSTGRGNTEGTRRHHAAGEGGQLALQREDWSWAEPLAREALSLSTAVGRLQLIEASSRKLAEALVRQGKKTEAVTHAKRALD